MLPAFDEHGLLPAGDYEFTLDELRGSLLVGQARARRTGTRLGGEPWSTTSR